MESIKTLGPIHKLLSGFQIGCRFSVGVQSDRCLSMGSDKALTDSGYLSTSSKLNIGEPQKLIFESTSSVNITRKNMGSQSFMYSINEKPKQSAHDCIDSSINNNVNTSKDTLYTTNATQKEITYYTSDCKNNSLNKTSKDDNRSKHALNHQKQTNDKHNTENKHQGLTKARDNNEPLIPRALKHASAYEPVVIRPRQRTTGRYEENEDMFYPNSTVLKVTKASRPQFATSFWLGCEYKYLFVAEELKVKFHHTGVLPREYNDNNMVFIKVTLGEGRKKKTKTVKLGKVGNLKKDKTEIKMSGFSRADVMTTDLKVNLYIEKGIFSSAKLLGEWSFPIEASKLLSWQSKWVHILG